MIISAISWYHHLLTKLPKEVVEYCRSFGDVDGQMIQTVADNFDSLLFQPIILELHQVLTILPLTSAFILQE